MAFDPFRRAGALVLALTLSTPALRAEPAPTKETREATRSLMADGRKLRAAGDHEGAARKFKAAFELMRIPTTGLEYGKSLLDLGKLSEAREVLKATAALPHDPGEPAPFGPAREEAATLAASTEKKIPSIRLVVRGAKASKVMIDGVDVGTTMVGTNWTLDPGHHVVAVEATGQPTNSQEFDVVAGGGLREIVLVFTGESPAASPSSGSATSPLVWLGFGVAGAGAVVGSVAGFMVLSKRSSLDDSCPAQQCPPPSHEALDSAKRWGTVSTISFGIAGVGAILGVVGLFTPRKAAVEEPTTGLRPWIGVGTAGVSGTF